MSSAFSSLMRKKIGLNGVLQDYLHKCEDNYFILQNKYLRIYEDSFGVKILRDNFALNYNCFDKKIIIIIHYPDKELVQESL